MEFKLDVIKYYETNGFNKRATARKFKIPRDTVRGFVKKSAQFKEPVKDRSITIPTRRYLKKERIGKYPQIDEEVMKGIEESISIPPKIEHMI